MSELIKPPGLVLPPPLLVHNLSNAGALAQGFNREGTSLWQRPDGVFQGSDERHAALLDGLDRPDIADVAYKLSSTVGLGAVAMISNRPHHSAMELFKLHADNRMPVTRTRAVTLGVVGSLSDQLLDFADGLVEQSGARIVNENDTQTNTDRVLAISGMALRLHAIGLLDQENGQRFAINCRVFHATISPDLVGRGTVGQYDTTVQLDHSSDAF